MSQVERQPSSSPVQAESGRVRKSVRERLVHGSQSVAAGFRWREASDAGLRSGDDQTALHLSPCLSRLVLRYTVPVRDDGNRTRAVPSSARGSSATHARGSNDAVIITPGRTHRWARGLRTLVTCTSKVSGTASRGEAVAQYTGAGHTQRRTGARDSVEFFESFHESVSRA